MTLVCHNPECQRDLAGPVNFCPFCGTPVSALNVGIGRAATDILTQDAGSVTILKSNLVALKYCAPNEDIAAKEVFAAACARFITTEGLKASPNDVDELLRQSEAAKQRILSFQSYSTEDVEEAITIRFD